MEQDHELIAAIAERSDKAFTVLYQQYSEKVYNTAISYTKNILDAEEVTQDVFLKVFSSIAQFKGNASLSTWIYRITVNTSLNCLKKKNRLKIHDTTDMSQEFIDFEHPGVLLENKENAATLYRVMDYLPETQKTAFILSYIEYLPRQMWEMPTETSV